MKKTLLALALLGAVPMTHATTVTLSGGPTGPSVFQPGGTSLVPNGSVIRVGTLQTPGDVNSFIEFGTSTVKAAGPPGAQQPSKVVGSVANTEENPGVTPGDSDFDGDQIYIWIYNATTVPTDPTARQAIEQGLFRSDTLFPTNDGSVGLNDSVSPQATSFLTAINLPFQLVQATVNMTGDNGTGNATGGRFVLGAIPEPTTGMLALGAAMALGFRRRK
jgi:hypothetical protein